MENTLSKEHVFDGIGYEPSLYSRAMFVPLKTDYDQTKYENANQDKNKKLKSPVVKANLAIWQPGGKCI